MAGVAPVSFWPRFPGGAKMVVFIRSLKSPLPIAAGFLRHGKTVWNSLLKKMVIDPEMVHC